MVVSRASNELARLFQRHAFDSEAALDAFAREVLGTLLLERTRSRVELVRELSDWRSADAMFQRRAACIALSVIAPQGDAACEGFTRLSLALCSACVWSIELGDQTAVGSLLRELSHAEPARVDAFVRRHARFMSPECMDAAIERLPDDRQRALREHWQRAVTLR